MRFVFAIVAFIVAAAMIGLGLAQRTVFAPAKATSASVTLSNNARYAIIDGSVLNAHPDQQTVKLSGTGGTDAAFLAYGRTADVKAWLGTQPYDRIGYDALTDRLSVRVVHHKTDKNEPAPTTSGTPKPGATPGATSGATSTATPPATPTQTPSAGSDGAESNTSSSSSGETDQGPDPNGSDLWLEAYSGKAATTVRMNVPTDVSVLIAADGTQPAPQNIRLSWPVDTATPWAGPLIVGGILLLLIGILLYLLGLRHLRRSRGPRRKSGTKMPKPPKPAKFKPSRSTTPSSRGRRSNRRRMTAVIGGTLLVPLALAGCSSDYWPSLPSGSTPAPTATTLNTDVAKLGKNALPPAVTEPQLQAIVAKISTRAAKADAEGKTGELDGRFTAAALQMRSTNYEIRAAQAKNKVKKSKRLDPLAPIPAGPIAVALPMATKSWPRVVDTIVQNAGNPKQAPLMLVLKQQTPRTNYEVNYAIPLEPNTTIPDVAPASIGTSIVPPDTKLLTLAPADLVQAYGDVMSKGEKSKYFDLFDLDNDVLYSQLGPKYKAKKAKDLADTAKLTYSHGQGDAPTIALATIDSGALVAAYLTETESIKAVKSGAEVSVGQQTAALIGTSTSKTGANTTYGYQLLFYVPPAGSSKKISLLGFSQGMISATEVKKK